ncbi:transcriptional regulator, AraC family [Parasphingorhabdus marina DSM 22363]|uniref:Transcriptional regulator, AraC family n=1 Tax=Parasphingorhabdus marina DSM 22363 TaxID=1123272 RepID=A0A1N6CPX5_9SPHN|nr:helix-turn-helix domain-containing protein [Parasphingorhabdus marina]SIN60618.1 transcriptional regulator, AraC family [Parasphingorhabdus marina DSM 22363]
MSSLNQSDVKIRFFAPADPLKPYVSTLYLTEVQSSDGKPISDYLHPEWANLRFITGDLPTGAIGDGPMEEAPHFFVAGPTSRATRFRATNMRSWGIGLLPGGWVKLVGASAEDYADKSTDGDSDPVFDKFASLHQTIYDDPAPAAEEAARINSFLLDLLKQAPEDNELVQQAHVILVDPELGTVQEMADRLGIGGRSLDRLSRKAFGFAPKLLLRRQRFLRSLAENMLNPEQNWISTIDPQYYDQAHFGRDFQRFMGMSASAYKALPHPFMNAAVHGRMAAAGAGMQVLHDPSSK